MNTVTVDSEPIRAVSSVKMVTRCTNNIFLKINYQSMKRQHMVMFSFLLLRRVNETAAYGHVFIPSVAASQMRYRRKHEAVTKNYNVY